MYDASIGPPNVEYSLTMLMILPRSARLAKRWLATNADVRFTSITRRHASSGWLGAGAAMRHPGVVHEDVESAEVVEHCIDDALDGLGITDVERVGLGGLAELGRHGRVALFVARRDRDARAVLRRARSRSPVRSRSSPR